MRISPLGVVPKKEPNLFSIIHHLSSLNDEIDHSFTSVSYSSFEEALVKIRSFGHGALMAGLGFFFKKFFFYDMCLSMGCSLFCSYFEKCSKFLHWVVSFESGFDNVVHHLGDFLIGLADYLVCFYSLKPFSLIMRHFGVPLAGKKT